MSSGIPEGPMEAKYKVWVKVWVAKIQKKKKPLKSAA